MLNVDMLAQAVAVLQAGGVVAFPTDTLYGLAADPRSTAAVSRLFAVKRREAGHAIPLIAADDDQVRAVGRVTPLAARLGAIFWPGPLSIIVAAHEVVCSDIRAADGSIAVRVPASEGARALAAAFGFCITATSANLSGEPATGWPDVVRSRLGSRIDFLLDAGDAPGGPPSTIVDAREHAPRLVRAGAVPWDRVLESLR